MESSLVPLSRATGVTGDGKTDGTKMIAQSTIDLKPARVSEVCSYFYWHLENAAVQCIRGSVSVDRRFVKGLTFIGFTRIEGLIHSTAA